MDKAALGQSLTKFGQNLLNMAVTIRAMKESNCCGGYYGGYNNMSMMGSIWGGMRCGMPMASTQWMPGGCGNYMGGMDMSGIMAQITQGMSYEAGYESFMRDYNNTVKSNPKADAVDKNTSADKANDMDDQLNKLGKGKIDKVDISSSTSEEQYKKDLTALGKSYVAQMDSDKDGYISKEEYLKENAKTDDRKKAASNQFEAIDINNDGVIDYKEMSSTFYAMDYEKDGKTKRDGYISAKRVEEFQFNIACDEEKSTPESVKAEVDLMQQGWKKLFGSDEKKS
ncbi:hypothetical protein J6E39_03915 [bacterium]|nr:hypothetical protein [bacterium]